MFQLFSTLEFVIEVKKKKENMVINQFSPQWNHDTDFNKGSIEQVLQANVCIWTIQCSVVYLSPYKLD